MASWDAFFLWIKQNEGETSNDYFQEKLFVLLGKHKSFICGAEPNQKRLKRWTRFQKDCFWTISGLLTRRRILSCWVQFVRFPYSGIFWSHFAQFQKKWTSGFHTCRKMFIRSALKSTGGPSKDCRWVGSVVEMELHSKELKKCYSALNFARRAFCQSFFSFRLPLAESANCAVSTGESHYCKRFCSHRFH